MRLALTIDHAIAGVSFAIGAGVATATPWGIAFSILQPALAMRAGTRRGCWVAALSYYAGALLPLLRGSANFFGPDSNPLSALAVYVGGCVLLSLPFFALWGAHGVAWRAPLAVAITVLPPLGLIAWASPLTAAGFIFPGFAWAGLALTLLVIAGLAFRPLITVPVVLISALIANIAYVDPKPPAGWIAVQTAVHEENPIVGEYVGFGTVHAAAEQFPAARVILFPEAVFPAWTPYEQSSPMMSWLRDRHLTVLVGAVQPEARKIDYAAQLALLTVTSRIAAPQQLPKYRNMLVSIGSASDVYEQRVPVPIGMWRPFTGGGSGPDLFSRGVIPVDGERAGVLICYEALIPWPILHTAAMHPTVLLVIANDYWAHGTTIRMWQQAATASWSRLFRLPYLFSVNE